MSDDEEFVPEEAQSETQGHDPYAAALGDEGQGDLAPGDLDGDEDEEIAVGMHAVSDDDYDDDSDISDLDRVAVQPPPPSAPDGQFASQDMPTADGEVVESRS